LATVYGIVKQHQGWIDVSTQIGTGSTFTLFLPAIEALAPAHAQTEHPSKPSGGKESILLVEDEDSVRLLTRRLLEKFGYIVHEAASGRAALELCHSPSFQVDLLLTDIIMPEGVTGRELAERLLADNPRLKVIFTSGYSGDVLGHDTEFLRKTNSRFVAKPCSSQLLLQTIRQYLDELSPLSCGGGSLD
jgi:CheY-like chemotaxis protein